MCHGSQQEGDGSRKEKHSDIQNGYSLQILEILGRPVSVLPPLIRDHPRRRLPIYSGTYFNENTHILRCWADATSKGAFCTILRDNAFIMVFPQRVARHVRVVQQTFLSRILKQCNKFAYKRLSVPIILVGQSHNSRTLCDGPFKIQR